jgi:hypothetical protein
VPVGVQLIALAHGWSGLALGYASVQLPMMAGMLRERASLQRLLWCPILALPATALFSWSVTLATPALRGLGMEMSGPWHLAANIALCAGAAFLGGRLIGRVGRCSNPDLVRYQRGALVATAEAASRGRSRVVEPSRIDTLTLAGVPVAAADETKHFKFIGTTGTGKSTAIAQLLDGALRRGDRAVIADPEGDYLQRFYRPERGDVILNPFDQRSVKWDLFAEIRHDYDVDQLARSLLPDHEGADRSWNAYARTFFTAVTRQAHAAGLRDLMQLYRLLVVADAEELRTLVRGTPAQPFLDPHNSRMFDSIRSVTSSAVGTLEHVALQRAAGFSLRHWVEQRDSNAVLFMPYQAGQIAALRACISAWMRIAIFAAMDRAQPDQRLWFVVDELDALGQIDGLKDALVRLRKFGGRCVLGLQSVAQAAATYGTGEAHTLIENCGNSLILRCSASEGGGTARFASTLIGRREVSRVTRSHSRRVTELFGTTNHGEQLVTESAVMDSEIEQLPDLCGYLKFASRAEWLRIRLQPAAPIASSARGAGGECSFQP